MSTAGHQARLFSFVLNSWAMKQDIAYSYGFGVCLGRDDAFHAARIHYTYETAGD